MINIHQDLDSGAWIVESGSLVKYYDETGRPFDLESDIQICAWNIGYRLGVSSRK